MASSRLLEDAEWARAGERKAVGLNPKLDLSFSGFVAEGLVMPYNCFAPEAAGGLPGDGLDLEDVVSTNIPAESRCSAGTPVPGRLRLLSGVIAR